MNRVHELAAELGGPLAGLGYTPHQTMTLDGDHEAVVFAAARRGGLTVCVVAALGPGQAGPYGARKFVARLRKALSVRYAGWPRPGRLATYTVLLGNHDSCLHLRDHTGRLIDTGRWHVNVMLGTVLVDMEEFRLHANTTWGLVDTGDQFDHIRRTVEAWCGRHRKPQRGIWSSKRRQHVA